MGLSFSIRQSQPNLAEVGVGAELGKKINLFINFHFKSYQSAQVDELWVYIKIIASHWIGKVESLTITLLIQRLDRV